MLHRTMRIGIYPGTFDPITYGHLDLVSRALRLVDRLVVAVAEDTDKHCMFSSTDRVAMVRSEVLSLPSDQAERVEVTAFSGLLVRFMDQVGAEVIFRGLRAVSDFEYEFQMACMNTRLHPGIDTVFLPASEDMQFVSSRFIKQICQLGGDITGMASPEVTARLRQHYQERGLLRG
jgi:pantetheine-phosphate adenylyltransferase